MSWLKEAYVKAEKEIIKQIDWDFEVRAEEVIEKKKRIPIPAERLEIKCNKREVENYKIEYLLD